MAAAVGPNAGFTYGWAAGASWDMSVNWDMLDAEFMLAIISMTLTAPPSSPAAGDRYWIATGSTPTGAWANQAGTLARYTSASAWEFFTLKEGTLCRYRADNRVYHFDGAGNWLSVTPQVSSLGVLTSAFGARQLDFQNGFTVKDAGSGYFQISLTGAFSQAIVTTVQGSAAWPFDSSGNSQTIATGSYTSVPVGSGLLIVNNFTNGDVGVYAVGGGVVVLIASTAGSFVTGSSPASGKMGVYYSSSSGQYTLYSNYGSSVSVGISGIRTRPNA